MRFLNFILIFFLIFPSFCFSQNTNWELTQDELVWKPSEPFKWDFPNNFSAIVVYLQEGVISPDFGILVKVDDWVEITRVIDDAEQEALRIKKRERDNCDEELTERDATCKRINQHLVDKIEKLEKDIIKLDLENSDFKRTNGLLKKGIVISIIATSSILIYYNVSK